MKLIDFDGGVLQRYDDFEFGPLAPRHVDVWLPPSYERTGEPRPVLYMHDGQNLFGLPESYGGKDWGVDDAILRLSKDPAFAAPIVVGVWNSADRWREYMPQKHAESGALRTSIARFAHRPEGRLLSDAYLAFLVREVKPLVDATYRTLPDRDHTATMGSSLGGLISLYALEQHPEVFGGAGCVSTHWPAGRNALVHAMGMALPQAGAHRLYFDYGTAGVDATYAPYQQRMDGYGRAAGYRQGEDWVSLKFPGADHSETAWRGRVHLPLQLLFDRSAR